MDTLFSVLGMYIRQFTGRSVLLTLLLSRSYHGFRIFNSVDVMKHGRSETLITEKGNRMYTD